MTNPDRAFWLAARQALLMLLDALEIWLSFEVTSASEAMQKRQPPRIQVGRAGQVLHLHAGQRPQQSGGAAQSGGTGQSSESIAGQRECLTRLWL